MAERKNAVLFVDDEPHILSSIRRATIDEEFEPLFAGNGQEALEIFEKRTISVIVTDMRMPEMDGLTLLKIIKEKYPQTVRMVLSGYTQLSQVLVTVNQADIFQFIPKPWSMEEELLAAVRQGIKQFNMALERDRLRDQLAQRNQSYQKIFHEWKQNFANEKKDMANLKKVHQWIFAFWRKNLNFNPQYQKENKALVIGYAELFETILEKYIDILPTSVEVKTLGAIIAGIGSACSERVEVQSLHNQQVTFAGYHTVLVTMLQSLLDLFAVEEEEKMVCTIKLDADEGNAHLIAVKMQPSQTSQASPLVQNKLKMGCAFIGEIGKEYHVWIKPEVVEGKIEAIQLVAQSTDEKEPTP